jgi:hypothetical protein
MYREAFAYPDFSSAPQVVPGCSPSERLTRQAIPPGASSDPKEEPAPRSFAISV